jgi:NADPH:quinone reductase-like Zn-dependent oxidoreductase
LLRKILEFTIKAKHLQQFEDTMKAVVYDAFGKSDVLKVREVQTPQVKEDEVKIRLAYSGVNPVDYKIREGYLQDAMPHQFPIISGWEGAGTVEDVGSQVTSLSVGDEVFGYFRLPVIGQGTYAEYITLPEHYAVKLPKSLTKKEAACIPLTALTAWQALFDAAGLKANETCLIRAAAGGVGSMAVQLAHHKKAKVFGTCQEANFSYVKGLGADVVIDYTKQNVVDTLKQQAPDGVDVVLDCAGVDEALYFSCLKPNGRYISIVDLKIHEKAPENIHAQFVFVEPNKDELEEIGALFDAGRLQCPEIREFPLEEAGRAQDLVQARHVRGKIVLRM